MFMSSVCEPPESGGEPDGMLDEEFDIDRGVDELEDGPGILEEDEP